MSGIAEVLRYNLGFSVSGSGSRRQRDDAPSGRAGHPHRSGMPASMSVKPTPSSSDGGQGRQPRKWARARARSAGAARPDAGRTDALKQGIAIAGTHGKTTTTSLVASILAEGGMDPTFVIGGRLNAAGANARLGRATSWSPRPTNRCLFPSCRR